MNYKKEIMPNYERGKIYKIMSDRTEKVYIGSTTKINLSSRLTGHKASLKRYERWLKGVDNKASYMTSFEILKLGDVKIILLEKCQCKTERELQARESFHIRQHKTSVNMMAPGDSCIRPEWLKEHCHKHICLCDKQYKSLSHKWLNREDWIRTEREWLDTLNERRN